MGRFDESALAEQVKSPAAPKGLKQAAGAALGQAQGDTRFADSALAEQYQDVGPVGLAQSWYTGANTQGVVNGWNTDFWDRTMEANEKAAAMGAMNTQFENPEIATGVVTWDHESSDGTKKFTFGDIYDNGQRVGNVYEQFGDATANLMMADVLFDPKTKSRIFESVEIDPETGKIISDGGTGQAVQDKRVENNTQIPKALTAADFNEDVQARQEEFQDGAVDEAIVGGGVAGGAALGAGVGAIFGGVGAVPGAILGGAVGGVAAWLNEDALTEQAARAYEITSMSERENGTGAAFATGLNQWAGFASKMITPAGNLTQGLYDVAQGTQGDGESEFYRTDATGERKAGTLIKVADVATSIGDMALQFASPIGVLMYTSQMSGVIGGEVAELGLTGGSTFDYQRGGFDNIFTDDQGNFAPDQAAAGIGKIGIDVLQLGMARGITGKVQAGRMAVGEKMVGEVGTGVLSRIGSRIYGKGVGTNEVGRVAGYKFIRNEAGELEKKMTLSLLAPSEMLSSMSARVLGMRQAARAKGAYSTDDFYSAANALAVGEKKWTTALVNGMGEGYEEGVQAVLEPYSHDGVISAEDIGNQALYGFAGGVGMGLGTNYRSVSADTKMFSQAQTAMRMRTGGVELTRTEWDKMSDVQKRGLAALSGIEEATASAAFKKYSEDAAIEMNAGIVGAARFSDAIEAQRTQALARGTDRTDAPFVIIPFEATDEFPSDAVVSSGKQLAINFNNRLRGVQIQLGPEDGSQVGSLHGLLAKAAAAVAADPTDADAAQRMLDLTRRVEQTKLMIALGQQFQKQMDTYFESIYDPAATIASRDSDVAALNDLIQRAFHRQINTFQGNELTAEDKMALARVVSQIATRDPQDQAGSYQVFMPQVSARLTSAGADNVLEISIAVLPALRGDYDGDKIRTQEQLMLDEVEFTNARAGMHFIGSGTSVNVKPSKSEKYNVARMSQAIADGGAGGNYASGVLTQIGDDIRRRYTGVIGDKVLDEVLKRFYDAVHAGTKDARAALLDGLAELAGGPLNEYARKNLTNEWIWIDRVVRSNLQQFQEIYAAHRPDIGPPPNTDAVLANKQSQQVKERKIVRAATIGNTVGLMFTGDSAFRQSQKLHYTSLVAAVLSADNSQEGQNAARYALAQLYEALGQGLTQSELDRVRGKDDITTRVYARLNRLSLEAQRLNPDLNPVEAAMVIGNIAIEDIDVAEDGTTTGNGQTITLAQWLLRQSVFQDQRKNEKILDVSPELQSKYARLLGMTREPRQGTRGSMRVNAERAFIEVIGSQQLFALLGEDANVFGPHLSVEQFVRMYVSKSPRERRSIDNILKGEAAYLGRESSKNLPYTLAEISAGEVSPYRSIVDSIIAVGHARITIDKEGNLHGELAKRSNDVGVTFRTAHKRIREALLEFAGLSPRQEGELTIDLIQRMIESDPDFAKQVMALIPVSAAAAVFEQRDNQTYVANWVYGMFALTDSNEAEVSFWRNVMLAQWNALGLDAREEETEEGYEGRKYSRLKRRTHRIIYNLHPDRQGDGGALLRTFNEQVQSATSVEEIIKWINTTPGILGHNEAPITAWVDDTAEFDMDKAQGGWTTALEGAELREAVTNLKRGSENLVKGLAEERASLASDNLTLGAIERVLAHQKDPSVGLDVGDQSVYDALQKRIDDAGELMIGLGPQQMVYQTVVAAMGFYAQAHTKGKNPEHTELEGAFDAMRDAIGYATNYERVMAALTSVSLDSLGTNLGEVAKDDIRSMDDNGVQVDSPRPTVASVVAGLKNADTRPLVRAMLFPQVMERDFDGALRPKLLVGHSLTSLLNGATHSELFPKNDVLSLDSALRYVSMAEAQSRKYGGKPHEFQRAVNDIVVARMSAADHVLSIAEVERITVETYYQAARLLQATAGVAAEKFKPGADPLADMLTDFKAAQRRVKTGRMLGLDAKDMATSDTILDDLVAEKRKQSVDEARKETKKLGKTKDKAEIERLTERIAGLKVDNERFEQKLKLLRSDDLAGNVVDMFSIPVGPIDGHKMTVITEYIATHWKILERSSASLLTLNKLSNQMLDPAYAGQPRLDRAEWEELSRAVIAVYIDEVVSSGGTSVMPYPDADHADSHRYYDTSFSYLIDPFFTRNSPLVQAGVDIHRRAGRQAEYVYTNDVIRLVGDTVFKDFNFGQWTSDIPRNSIEANERLDSAAAPQAIAMYGQSPKLQGVVSAATRRTFKLPLEEHFSTVDLSYIDLNRPVYDEVDVTMPGNVVRRPLAQLNNRFASSVTADIGGITVELLQDDPDYPLFAVPDLGRVWAGNDEAVGSGLQEIHLDRVRRAVELTAQRLGVSPAGATVQVRFLHPDQQPAGPEWMNNLWFEGTSFKMDADRHESLNATLWFAEGSLNPVGQATALDASKLGLSALKVVPVPTAAVRNTAEADWRRDFGAMLREKTKIQLQADIGTKNKLEPEFYNAVYKNLKMRHFVRGTDDQGNIVLWTAEKAMEAQAAGEALPTGAQLWVPSDAVLRDMLGEQGTQGTRRILNTTFETDLSLVPTYRGVTTEMLTNFAAGLNPAAVTTLDQTRIAHRSRQQQLQVRGQLTDAARNAYDARIKFHAELTEAARIDRALMYQNSENGFSPEKNLKRALRSGKKLLFAENVALDWSRAGIPFIGPRIARDSAMSERLLHELTAALAVKPGRTGWVFREGSEADTPRGMINQVSLGGSRPGLMVAPGDLVVVELDGFQDDAKGRALAKQRLDYMTDRGAIIVLGETGGRSDMRAEMADYLGSSSYERLAGSKHVYAPIDNSMRYQNQKARASTLMEVRAVSRRNMVSIFNVQDQSIEENGAWVVPDNPRMAAVGVTLNLMPVDALGGFNVPVESFTGISQIEKVRQHLFGLDNAEGRKLMRDMANGHIKEAGLRAKADLEFDQAFDRMIARLNDHPGTVMPQRGDDFGTGDFIPLVDGYNRVLLYRHGMKAPTREDVDSMMAATLGGSLDAHNIAVFPSKPEPASTTHTGTVVQVRPRSGYGLSIELNIPLQQFGDKKVLEWSGMKYLLTPMPDEIVLPDHPFFANGWGVDLVASSHDMVSKESFEGLGNNHRNWFAFAGIDFTPYVARFFNVNDRTARDILELFSRVSEKIPLEAADEILNGETLPRFYIEQLIKAGANMTDLAPVAWVNRLGNANDVDSQIVTAMLTYLSLAGTHPRDILRSGGFNDDSTDIDAESIFMPRMFTQVFDNAPLGSALRSEINLQLNRQLYNPKKDGTGYSLAQDFTFETKVGRLVKQQVAYVDAFDILSHYAPTDSGRTTADIKANVGDDTAMWERKIEEAKTSGLFTKIEAAGKILEPIILSDPGRYAVPLVVEGHHRLAAAAELGIPVPWRYESDTEGSRRTGAPAGVTKFNVVEQGRPGKNLRGFLQFAEAHSSGDNPIKNGMSFDETARGAVSQHSGNIAYQAIGADTAHKYDTARARIFAEGKGVERFQRDVVDGGMWRMLTGIRPNEIRSGHVFRAMGPSEASRHGLAHDAVVQFRQDVKKDDSNIWSDEQRKTAGDLSRDIVHKLGLKDVQSGLVDYWVRQVLGMPAGQDADGNELGTITGRGYIEAARDILWNVQNNYLPVVGAEVPLLHLNDLQLIYRTNLTRSNPWTPKESLDGQSTMADSWTSWTEVALGSALTGDNLFDPLYLLALDGFMHTYQSATPALMDLPVSLDTLKTFELLDPETNRLMISLDDKTDMIHSEPLMVEVARATLDDIIGGVRIAGVYKGKAAPASEVAKRREIRRKWRKENGVPVPVDVTMRNFRKNGVEFIDTSTTTSALARGLINLRVGTALINPALYVSMGPEQWIRGTLDRAANLLTGQSTAGITGKAAAKIGLSQYSLETVRNINRTTEALGRRTDFKRMIYGDLMYLRPVEQGIGRIERVLEAYAKFGSRLQDPTWGMSAKTLARRYVEAALQHINATPTLNTLTPDRLMAELATNPEFLKRSHPEAHDAGTNAIAQLRSLKATPLSLTLRGIYEPMSSSTNSATNFLGNVLLKLPMLFSGYAMNVLTTITGMQGASDLFAMAIEGRKRGPASIFGRIQALFAGVEFDGSKYDEAFDMSTVLEGIDLTRSFIRGGLTHTGLFMLGMMAGGLGLSGEDDEAKKRRKMAALQGAGFLYDPRQIENDFRNADAVFLDWLPGFDKYFKVTPGPDGRSMAQTHWMLKQFVSPMIGMERFFETGDFRQVTWGFQDALGSFPLINTLMWDDAVTTAHEFASMADEEAKLGGPTNMVAAAGLLANGVGVYERMLFENAFANMVYTSFDRYDRNPYALPQRDSDGDIQKDIENEPYEQDLGLQSFIDPESGELVRGYESRDPASGALHALTENRATLAFALTAFSGLVGVEDNDWFRRNQVVKTRSQEKATITQDQAEALIRLELEKQGGLPSLTAEEIKGALIQRNIANNVFQQPDQLQAEADAIARSGGVAPMSVLDKDGREHLTMDGAEAIFRGLFKKTVRLDDLSLQGAYITYPMREAIAQKWTKDLVQEGIELGLDQTKATSRMKRLMYGEFGTSQEGLAEILFKTPENGGLSYSDNMTYNQLNTTYVMGPDGRPWATGATRGGILGALGLKPLNRYYVSEMPETMGTDSRLNSTDRINGVNTGLRALELVDESRYIPTDVEIGKAIEKAIEDAAKADYTPLTPFKKTSGGNGWVNYGRGGYGSSRRRGYSGYSSGGNAYFTRMYTMPGQNLPYGNNIPFINTSNPITRRADIRRERVWSERGRLKQWQ